jgi:hypothetical protein
LYSCTRSSRSTVRPPIFVTIALSIAVRSDRILAEIPSGNHFFEKRAQQHVKVHVLVVTVISVGVAIWPRAAARNCWTLYSCRQGSRHRGRWLLRLAAWLLLAAAAARLLLGPVEPRRRWSRSGSNLSVGLVSTPRRCPPAAMMMPPPAKPAKAARSMPPPAMPPPSQLPARRAPSRFPSSYRSARCHCLPVPPGYSSHNSRWRAGHRRGLPSRRGPSRSTSRRPTPAARCGHQHPSLPCFCPAPISNPHPLVQPRAAATAAVTPIMC